MVKVRGLPEWVVITTNNDGLEDWLFRYPPPWGLARRRAALPGWNGLVANRHDIEGAQVMALSPLP